MTPSLISLVETTHARLADITQKYAAPTFGTSFGLEDLVLLHMIATRHRAVDVFSLDTLLLPTATLELWKQLEQRLGLSVRGLVPDASAVQTLESEQGRYGMYDSVENRHRCCDIRKVQPLALALVGKDAWLTGVRRSQSAQRADTPLEEFDALRGVTKFNPLADWTDEDVQAYIDAQGLPMNALHAKGYPSIGCDPCTRAIKPGEHPRAGRWWWEQSDTKECGLHWVAPVDAMGSAKIIPIRST